MGLFVKHWVCRDYSIDENYKIFDDMLGIMFTNKITGYKFMIYSVYLPPERSTVYSNAPEFFNRLIVEVYKYVDIDALYFVGDINARLGNLSDISDIDNVPNRTGLENEVNNHGKAFREFLVDSKCCVINSRTTPEHDDFTSISTKGRAVVDYFFVPHEDLVNVTTCYVDTCSHIVTDLGIENLVSDVSKVPDHSLMTIEVKTSPYSHILSQNLGAKNYYNDTCKPRHNLRKIPDDFMTSENFCNIINRLIDDITLLRESQSEVDQAYDKLVNVILKEMKDEIPMFSNTCRRKHTPFKPYWDENLTSLWRITNDKQRVYTRFKGHRTNKENLRKEFETARNRFDKYLRQRQRAYRRGLLIEIEECNTSDHRRFWKHINNLGPKRKQNIPWEVYDNQGNICYEKTTVLKKWEDEYFGLFNNKVGEYDESFYKHVLDSKAHFERNMLDPLYIDNRSLNKPLEIDEVKKAVDKAKFGKASGVDGIPNEVLKSDFIVKYLHAFFQMCLDYSIIPSPWTQAIICPIPKSKNNDPRLPLSYRGLSLLSCIYKIYSSVLNNRLVIYLENNNILHDEQNGFRSKRSCQDHIFSLTSLVKNKINESGNIFACYVDFRKAFDLVSRDLLLFRLLEYGVNGNFYNTIKCIYTKSTCAVRVNDSVTNWFSADQGVKQGDNLSPSLFSIFLNSLITDLKALGIGVQMATNLVCVLAYADDLVLVAENEMDLQKLLDTLYNWCHKWRLCINTEKTKVMHFRKKDLSKNYV